MSDDAIDLDALHKIHAVMVDHRERGFQLGSQVYVALDGSQVAHLVDGWSVADHLMTGEHLMRWYEAGMPLISVLVAQSLERGKLSLDDRVGSHLDEWSGDKHGCTIRHVLMHMGGFASAELGDRDIDSSDAVQQICRHRAEHQPGGAAQFHSSPGWKILAAILEKVERRSIEKLIERRIAKPIDLQGEIHIAIGAKKLSSLTGRIAPVHWHGLVNRTGEPLRRDLIHNTTWHMAKVDPGISAWGTAYALGRFYDELAAGAPNLLESSNTLDLFTAVHRHGVRDRHSNGATVPWGLGFQVAGSFSGSLGHRAFGHDGLTGRALCDPADRLSIVYLTNGLASRIDHERRMSELSDVVYDSVLPRPSSAWITTGSAAIGV